MPTVAVFDMTGKKTGEMELNAAVFGIEPNMTVVHAAVKNYLANQRQGTQSTLTRAEASEGHRPCSSGFYPLSAVDPWWYCPRPEAPFLQLQPDQEDQASGYAVRSVCKGSSRRDHRNRWPGYGRDQDQVLRWFPERS